ncbi:hypothetical protein [Actinomadura sp. NTSP31]|uniref:hypothetical protein n=1 Tax=Actinomadura sp. NTSP31 TaxID=1735447 RepID=UPI0035C17E89
MWLVLLPFVGWNGPWRLWAVAAVAVLGWCWRSSSTTPAARQRLGGILNEYEHAA